MKESFFFYISHYEPVKSLSDEELGQLFRLIFEYQITGVTPVTSVTSGTKMA